MLDLTTGWILVLHYPVGIHLLQNHVCWVLQYADYTPNRKQEVGSGSNVKDDLQLMNVEKIKGVVMNGLIREVVE